MYYPIAIETGTDQHAFGVAVPDLPGCFSAGDTLDEAMSNAKEAIELHLEDLAERGEPIPEPISLESHRKSPEYRDWIWAIVDVDDASFRGKAVRINITMREGLLGAIDRAASEAGLTRSGLLAAAAELWLKGVEKPAIGTGKPKRPKVSKAA